MRSTSERIMTLLTQVSDNFDAEYYPNNTGAVTQELKTMAVFDIGCFAISRSCLFLATKFGFSKKVQCVFSRWMPLLSLCVTVIHVILLLHSVIRQKSAPRRGRRRHRIRRFTLRRHVEAFCIFFFVLSVASIFTPAVWCN